MPLEGEAAPPLHHGGDLFLEADGHLIYYSYVDKKALALKYKNYS
jgi:hypothetical protein